MSTSDIIREGDYVVVKLDTTLRIIQVRKERPMFLGKRVISVSSSIGFEYGSFFEVKGNGALSLQTSLNPFVMGNIAPSNVDEVEEDKIVENISGSQRLKTSDIEAFKKEGLPGEDIVKIIVENSTSFKEKSLYSQEKYLKKKQQKYINIMQILKPNTRLLVETYYLYSPQKICNLRIDSLSQILTFCNVISGGNYLVVDSVLGLLTASVLERIGSSGLVVQAYISPSPPNTYMDAVKALNLSRDHLRNVLYSADFCRILSLLKDETCNNTILNNDNVTDNNSSVNEFQESDSSMNSSPKEQFFYKVKDVLMQKSMDSLLVAIKHHPSCAIPLLDFLSYSRPFAFYCMYQEPLIECYESLKARGDIILLNIHETWLRKYQVLSERTHPEYNMSTNGGYLLTGIKVEQKP